MKGNFRFKGLCVVAGLLAYTPAMAATFLASSGADSGVLSLRQAILDANATAGADIITITASTVTLNSALPQITEAVTISGLGATSTLINGASGARIFDVNNPSGTVSIEKVTIRGAGTVTGDGAGIRANGAGTLSLSQVAVESNAASASGGGLYTANPTSISQSTFSGNSASTGGAIAVNAAPSAAITIINSTLSGNTAATAGAGIDVLSATTVSITSSTIAYNNVTTLGALNGAGVNVGTGGGAYSLIATLLAINNAASTDRNCGCSYSSCSFLSTGTNGVNVDTANSCNFGSGNIVNAMTDPSYGVNGAAARILAPLANNGGATSTHAIPATSPALDYANNAACPTVDQRGEARRTDSNGDGRGVCETGAFEAAAFSFVSTTPTTGTGSSSGGGGGGGGGCTTGTASSDPVMPALLLAGLTGLWLRARRKV